MSLIEWNPFNFDGIGREMSHFLERTPFGFLGKAVNPKVDVYQTDEEVIVKAEVPGISKEDISIYLDDNSLRLSGTYKKENDFKEQDIYRNERYYGSFSRVIPLPVEIVSAKAAANYTDGILTIKIPKVEGAKLRGKKIEIQ